MDYASVWQRVLGSMLADPEFLRQAWEQGTLENVISLYGRATDQVEAELDGSYVTTVTRTLDPGVGVVDEVVKGLGNFDGTVLYRNVDGQSVRVIVEKVEEKD